MIGIISYVWSVFMNFFLYAFFLFVVLSILNSFNPINNFFKKLISDKWNLIPIALVLLVPFAWIEIIEWSGSSKEFKQNDTAAVCHVESINFEREEIQDSSIYLDDSGITANGVKGEREICINPDGSIASNEIIKEPVKEIFMRGIKRGYQYMWCSDGSYRFFSDTDYKNGSWFVDNDVDDCAENSHGYMIKLADYPPTQQETGGGAICNDGTRSYSTGRGTCSHHEGVAQWL
jgi:hypothetical protein